MTDLFNVFLLSTTPFGELRLSIPVGMAIYHLDTISVYLVSVAGNSIASVFLLLFLKNISVYLSEKSKLFQKMFTYWKDKAQKKHYEKIQKYGAVGLTLFVAIPLPLTGSWTGALLATMADLPIKKSLPAILIGIVIAGFITTIAVVIGFNIKDYFGWQALVGTLIFLGLVYYFLKKQ